MAPQLLMMLLIFAVFYFILIRPQVKKQKEHQAMLGRLQKGDMIVTRGGVVGKITGVGSDTLTVELQEKVRVRILRSYVDGKHLPQKTQDSKDADRESKAA